MGRGDVAPGAAVAQWRTRRAGAGKFFGCAWIAGSQRRWVLAAMGVGVLSLAGCTARAPEPAAPLPAEPAMTVLDPLAGSSWSLSDMADRVLLPHRRISLDFGAGGIVSGSDACRPFRGGYRVTADGLQFDEIPAAVETSCPAAVRAQAAAYWAALREVRNYRLSGDDLHLTDARGTPLLIFQSSAQVLAGTSWVVTGYAVGTKEPVGILAGTEIRAAFNDNGRVTGHAGCNSYVADYHREGYAISIGVARSTRMHCAAPAGVMEQERRFLAALPSAVNVWFFGDKLELRDDTGALVVTMRRASE